MKKLLYITFLVTLSLSKGLAQNIDSLKLELKNAKYDTTRVKLLSELSEVCEVEDILLYAEPCVKICEKAIPTNISLKNFYLTHLSGAYNNIGFLAQNQGKTDKAAQYYQKCLAIQVKIQDKNGIANSLNNIGAIYNNQGDIAKALEYFHKSLEIREIIKDKYGIANSLNNVGFIYDNQGDKEKALEYYQKSLILREEIKDVKGIANTLNNIGVIYNDCGDKAKALSSYQKSLTLQEEINDKTGIANSLNNVGFIYDSQGDKLKALAYYQKSLQIFKETNDKKGISSSLINIASILLIQGKHAESFLYANQSFQLAKELGYPDNIKNAATSLKDIYKKQKNYAAAFDMYELEIQMSDSINNEATKKASIQKQFQYEYEKKGAADSMVFAKENEIKEVEIARQKAEIKVKQNQQLALYGGLLLVLVFAGFMYNRFKVTQKQKTIIEQQKTIVETAHLLLEEKNEEIIASIRYAKRIQDAIMTSQKYMERNIERLKSTNKI